MQGGAGRRRKCYLSGTPKDMGFTKYEVLSLKRPHDSLRLPFPTPYKLVFVGLFDKSQSTGGKTLASTDIPAPSPVPATWLELRKHC